MTNSLPWATAWVTGASSGIGRELALMLAARGVVVAVSARSGEALAELGRINPRIRPYPVDVSDAAAVRQTAERIIADLGALDLAVLNAGVWHPMGAKGYEAAKAAQSMAVNYLGIANALEPLIPHMIGRGRGKLALVSSVAGYRGLPMSAAYGPTKAAVINLAEGLKPDLERFGVQICVVNPGFVDTPMTAVNTFPMPFMISVKDAATRIADGLTKDRFEIAFPWRMVLTMKVARLLCYRRFFWYARTFLMPASNRK